MPAHAGSALPPRRAQFAQLLLATWAPRAVGAFFVTSAIAKALSPEFAATDVRHALQLVDVTASLGALTVASCVIVTAEAIVGLSLMFLGGLAPITTALSMLAAFSTYLVVVVAQDGGSASCRCLGPIVTSASWGLTRNSLLLGLLAASLVARRRVPIVATKGNIQ